MQPRIYLNLSDADKIFQLGARSYKDYKKAIVNTMLHFIMKAHEIENTNTSQVVPYERRRVTQESDPDYSDCDTSINSIQSYNMDREQAESNRNESNDGWVDIF